MKTILITGATDGIGLATAKILAAKGHRLLIHGRSTEKLERAKSELESISSDCVVKTYRSDFSSLHEVANLAEKVLQNFKNIDVLINNAGVFKTANPITDSGFDLRFIVNTVAPYLLTRSLMPLLKNQSRVINLSSAAQASVNINAFWGKEHLTDMEAYAQSKLAITMWTHAEAQTQGVNRPILIAVNPGSLLASKMVKQGFGVSGKDINIGANVLTQLALNDEALNHSGEYFDNDKGKYAELHSDCSNSAKVDSLIKAIEEVLNTSGL